MKYYEMKIGKQYRDAVTGLKYRVVEPFNFEFYMTSKGRWEATVNTLEQMQNLELTEVVERKPYATWQKAMAHMREGKVASFGGIAYKMTYSGFYQVSKIDYGYGFEKTDWNNAVLSATEASFGRIFLCNEWVLL